MGPKKHSKDTRKKMAKAAKALWAKRRQEGFRHTAIARKHIGDATRKRCSAPGYTHNRTGSNPSRKTRQLLSQSTKKRMALGHPMRGKNHTPEACQKMSVTRKAIVALKGPVLQLKAGAARWRKHPTPPEKALGLELLRCKIHYRSQFIIGNRYAVDFYLPDFKAVIECDGISHRYPKGKLRDKIRDLFMQDQGLRVFRLKNESILKNAKAVLALVIKGLK